MSKKLQAPERTAPKSHIDDYKENHPAYGCCVVTQWSSTPPGLRLFGSDLKHSHGISLSLHEATLYRGLSGDRHHAGRVLLKVDLSAAQWARLVSAQGLGSGVPVTINYRQEGPLQDVPAIAAPDASKREVHGEEMAAALRERLDAMRAQIDKLGAALEEGRIGKRDLTALHSELRRHCDQLPGSVQFVYDQFARATEKVAEDAKTEVETYVAGVARNLGLDAIAQLPRLPMKDEK